MQIDKPVYEAIENAPRPLFVDPLKHDTSEDEAMVTTRRRELRLALVASETATRFARKGIAVDPMDWMLAPRRMFDGASAIDACGDREACLRAIVLHGIGEDLDADPSYLDALLDDGDEDEPTSSASRSCPTVARTAEGGGLPMRGPGRPRLYTAVFSHEDAGGFVQAFSAIVAPSAETLRRKLRDRHGEAAAAGAIVEEGFRCRSPLVDALVSPALAHVLEQIAEAPDSPLASGLDVRVEQRFHS